MAVSASGAAGRVALMRLAAAVTLPVALALLSWIWLALMIGDMNAIPGMSAMMMSPHRITSAMMLGLFVMWAVMMAAMMLPTAAPMILAYARMQAFDRAAGAGSLPVTAFVVGYLIVWSGFSLAAAGLQAVLTALALMSPMMMKAAAPVSAGILIGAGLYQFAPVKLACLRLCQSPLSFLMTRWRPGSLGALRMGLSHGSYCLGCCWAMMAVLFAMGVMNTAWIAGLTGAVLLEKLVPRTAVVSRSIGAGLIGLGLWVQLAAAG